MKDRKIAIVTAPFYQHIVAGLYKGAEKYLAQQQLKSVRFDVSGALETPLMCQFIAQKVTDEDDKKYSAIIVLGAVIRGETAHFEHVCEQSARGLMDVSLKHNLPISNGIITVENESQALKRSSDNANNKGYQAAHAAIELLAIKLSL